MQMKAIKHENTCIIGKETTSTNKQRLMRIASDLDKLANSNTYSHNYEAIENCFKEIQKVLETRKESDLHVLRQIRFIPKLMEIIKKITVCPKNEINDFMKILEASMKVLFLFCGQIDNRTYMIITNRPIGLVDLLIWCLNRPTKFIYSLNFVPTLFHILIQLIKHRLPQEHLDYKDFLIEYIFISGLLLKIKQKFMSFNSGLDLSMAKGKVPLALVKSVAFLESVINYYTLQ